VGQFIWLFDSPRVWSSETGSISTTSEIVILSGGLRVDTGLVTEKVFELAASGMLFKEAVIQVDN